MLTEAEFAAFHARAWPSAWAPTRRRAPSPAGDGLTKTSAAWLIDKAGFTKGYGTGPARISTKHTLALTNRGEATTEDLPDPRPRGRRGRARAFGADAGQRAGDGLGVRL
ncbi:hypothetical protein [Streptomyces sp. KL116D]|uniref:hypothetical protein n=1 Tax=Streptomyces sp. KL116D TaxID=3045152 RepID=UPI0035580175